MSARPRITDEDLGRLLLGLIRRSTPQAVSLTGDAVDSGTDTPPFDNPMTDVGDMMYGDEGGSAVRLGIGTLGDVWTVTLVGADLVPRWAAPTSGGGGGHYSQYVHALDSGTWEFVSVDVGGQLHPLTALFETEA